MKVFVVCMALLWTVPSLCLGDQTIVCRDERGVRTGSINIQESGRVTFRDRRGVTVGFARVMKGKTVFYDKGGRKTGEMTGGPFPLFSCDGKCHDF